MKFFVAFRLFSFCLLLLLFQSIATNNFLHQIAEPQFSYETIVTFLDTNTSVRVQEEFQDGFGRVSIEDTFLHHQIFYDQTLTQLFVKKMNGNYKNKLKQINFLLFLLFNCVHIAVSVYWDDFTTNVCEMSTLEDLRKSDKLMQKTLFLAINHGQKILGPVALFYQKLFALEEVCFKCDFINIILNKF